MRRQPKLPTKSLVLAACLLADLCGGGCGLDSSAINGAWFFCANAACDQVNSSGIMLREDGTYVEIALRDPKARSYCEIPGSEGTYVYVAEQLETTPRKGGKTQQRAMKLGEGQADIVYPASDAWTGGTFRLSMRSDDTSRGPCYDPQKPKATLESCTPPSAFHAGSALPTSTPWLADTAECASGHCGTVLCPSGAPTSVCLKIGKFCRFKKSNVEPPGPPPEPQDPVVCNEPETCLPFAGRPRCVNPAGICK